MKFAPTSCMNGFILMLTGVILSGGPSGAFAGASTNPGMTAPNVGNQGQAGTGQTVRKHFQSTAADPRCLRVAVAGVATRNAAPAPATASGTIVLPPGPGAGNIVWAGLYWEILGDTPPVNAVTLNGKPVVPQALPVSASPCWPELSAFPYFADVTALVVGGANAVSGLDDSGALGVGYNSEGASLVVVYQSQNFAACEIIVTDGNDLLAFLIDQYDNPLPVACPPGLAGNLYFIGADGQVAPDNQLWNGAALGAGDDYTNSDPLAPGASALVGWDSDLQPGGYLVPVVPPFTASSNNFSTAGPSDCVNWLVTVLEVGVHEAQCVVTSAKSSTWGQLRRVYR